MHGKKLRYLPLVLVLAVLLGSFLIGSVAAKYIYRNSWQATVTFTAELADNVLLQEHLASRAPDGSYSLDSEVVTEKNTYILLPGLDIPKDPFITVVDKSSIGSYLFLEVVDGLDGVGDSRPISYSLTDSWEALDVEGKHGGKVYVYSKNGSPVVIDDSLTEGQPELTAYIQILKDNKVTVSQYLKKNNVTENGDRDVLSFYAELNEVGTVTEGGTEQRTAEAVYQNATPSATP